LAGPGACVLLVVSDPRRASLASTELADANPGARVIHVETEGAFSEALEAGEFEIVLTDRQLDWADGITVLRSVKRRFPDCPVLMLSSVADLDLEHEGPHWGLYGAFQSASSKLSGLSDVVARARHEADLHRASIEAGANQSHLGDLVPTGLFRFAPDGVLLRANAAFAELLGHSDLDPLLATSLDRLFAKREEIERWRHMLDRHGAVAAFEADLVRRDGGVLRIEMAARAIRDATGPNRVLRGERSGHHVADGPRPAEYPRDDPRSREPGPDHPSGLRGDGRRVLQGARADAGRGVWRPLRVRLGGRRP